MKNKRIILKLLVIGFILGGIFLLKIVPMEDPPGIGYKTSIIDVA